MTDDNAPVENVEPATADFTTNKNGELVQGHYNQDTGEFTIS